MKKWKLKLMKQAAEQLPQGKQMVKKLGADMLKENPLMKLPNGDTIDPKKYYMAPAPKSNFRAVKKYFKNPENRKELNDIKK
jgi:hypothetical protein